MSVPMASFDGPTPSLSLTALLDRTRLQPLRATNTREWQDPTILDAEFGADTYGLAELLSMARFFSSKRSEAELSTFMGSLEKRFPPTCGWIWPLMDRFKALQGLRTVLVLMQCPLRERRFGMDLGQDACFTEYFAAGLESSKYRGPQESSLIFELLTHMILRPQVMRRFRAVRRLSQRVSQKRPRQPLPWHLRTRGTKTLGPCDRG